MKIFKIFTFKIGKSSVIRKLPIYEILKIMRVLYPLKELLLLILKNPHNIYFLDSLCLSNLINILIEASQ